MRPIVYEMGGKTVQSMVPEEGFSWPVTRWEECGRPGRSHEVWRWSDGDEPGAWIGDRDALVAGLIVAIDMIRDRAIAAVLADDVIAARAWQYDRKAREANDPVGPWPFMEAEAAAREIDIEAVRAGILARIAEPSAAELRGAAIEAAAVAAKAALADAADCDAADAIHDAARAAINSA